MLLNAIMEFLGSMSGKADVQKQPKPNVCAGGRGEYRTSVLVAFKNYDPLKPPATPAIRKYLEGKLAKYEKCINQQFAHPGIAQGFWKATLRVLVAKSVLEATGEVTLADLYIVAVAKYGDQLEPIELLNAWCTIAGHLGTPVPGLPITSDATRR